jgi:hypothetical protein
VAGAARFVELLSGMEIARLGAVGLVAGRSMMSMSTLKRDALVFGPRDTLATRTTQGSTTIECPEYQIGDEVCTELSCS